MTVTRKGWFIVSDRTRHSARIITGRFHDWEVSWLPDHRMSYDDALMAMTIADKAGTGHADVDLYTWVKRDEWADEVTLSAEELWERLQREVWIDRFIADDEGFRDWVRRGLWIDRISRSGEELRMRAKRDKWADVIGMSDKEELAWAERDMWADRIGLTAAEVLEHVKRRPAWRAGQERYYEGSITYDFNKQRRQSRRKAAEADAERDEPEAGG